MNNRKTRNKRGKNPRSFKIQTTNEPPKLKLRQKSGELLIIDNPKAGQKRTIVHINKIFSKK